MRYFKKWFRRLTRGKLVKVIEGDFVNAWEYESKDVYVHDRTTDDIIDMADEMEYGRFDWKILGTKGFGNFELNKKTYDEMLDFVGNRGAILKVDYANKFVFYKQHGAE